MWLFYYHVIESHEMCKKAMCSSWMQLEDCNMQYIIYLTNYIVILILCSQNLTWWTIKLTFILLLTLYTTAVNFIYYCYWCQNNLKWGYNNSISLIWKSHQYYGNAPYFRGNSKPTKGTIDFYLLKLLHWYFTFWRWIDWDI